jgi:hypothetical protein
MSKEEGGSDEEPDREPQGWDKRQIGDEQAENLDFGSIR